MRTRYLAVLVVSTAAASSSATAQGGPPPIPPSHHIRYYDVSGTTAESLQRSLDQSAPAGSHGMPYYGMTEWYVDWSYQVWRRGQDCKIVHARAEVRTTITLPNWIDSSEAPESLKKWWSVFIDTLREHEFAHVSHARAAREAVVDGLAGLDPKPTCGAARRAAEHLANDVVHDYWARDMKFDRDTRHGRDQLEAALAGLE